MFLEPIDSGHDQAPASAHHGAGSRKPGQLANAEPRRRTTSLVASAETVLAAEFVYAAAGIDDFLLTRIKGVTCRANFDREILTERRAGREFVAAATGHFDVTVIGVYIGFHSRSSSGGKRLKKGA